MRSELPRIHPGRKLTEAQWEELRLTVGNDEDHTVKELCRQKGVSVARFYKRFPKGERRILPETVTETAKTSNSPRAAEVQNQFRAGRKAET